MKTIKRIAAPMIAAVLCLLIAMSSIPVASALSAPQAPSKALYRSDYAIDEHCLIEDADVAHGSLVGAATFIMYNLAG